MYIKELSRKVGLNDNTVRYYCDQGVIPNVKRAHNGYRIFNNESIKWFKNAKMMREAGISIKDLRYYVSLCLQGEKTLVQRCSMLEKLISNANSELMDAKERVNYLKIQNNKYQQAINNKPNPDFWNPKNW